MGIENKQHQGESVALPERKGTHLHYDTLMPTFSKGWNACLDEIAKLGPLYTHSDPGEVGRLRIALGNTQALLDQANYHKAQRGETIDTLRAQLAELEALHGGELGLPKEGWPEYHKRKMETLRELTAGHYQRKLAERDALLRDTKRSIERNDYPVFELLKRIDATLSASAEPSAPKET